MLGMRDLIIGEFQQQVDDCLVRHRSILDVMAKYQERVARTNRAITKAVTQCGCLHIQASRQQLPETLTEENPGQDMSSHLSGEMCESCREIVENEMGATLFYMAALSNLLDVNMYDLYLREYNKLRTLGFFNFS